MPTSCPYCNSPISVPQPLPADGRVSCPRCDEMVTIGEGEAGTTDVAPIEAPAARRLKNRTVAGLVVAVMLGMAALGLAFALHTVRVRRANDSKGAVPPEAAADAKPMPPADWPGPGWLSDDVQAVAGIRVVDALDSAAGRSLLAQFGMADAKQTKILGLPLTMVDHLVFGASARALPPRVTAVVRTRMPIREGNAAMSSRTSDHHGKPLVHGKLWKNGPDGMVWNADPQTLIAALLPEDFDRLPAKPQTAGPLHELTARLDPEALAWLVATMDANSPAIALATPFLPPAEHDAWTKLDAVAASIRADSAKLTLTIQVRGKDAAAGAAIALALTQALKSSASGATVERTESGDWQRVTATGDAEKMLNGLRNPARQ